MLTRSGVYMYWNNSWFNNFNQKNYLLKTMFLESLIKFTCSEKIFKFFFFNRFFFSGDFFLKFIKSVAIQKKEQLMSRKLKKKLKRKKIKIKFNFSKLWFIKFNGFILITIFCFFFKWKKTFKVRQREKRRKLFLNKSMRLYLSSSWLHNKDTEIITKKVFFF